MCCLFLCGNIFDYIINTNDLHPDNRSAEVASDLSRTSWNGGSMPPFQNIHGSI